MKSIISSLLFILAFVNILYTQEQQITDIQNQIPFLEYEYHGFVNINGLDYLIQSNNEAIRVSKVDGELEVLYEEEYPAYLEVNNAHGRLNTRSGFAMSDIYLFEIFRKEIRQRNLLTGEIIETYYFSEDQLRSIKNLVVIDEIFHFEISGNHDFATYNTITEEFTFLEFSEKNTYRFQNTYFASEVFQGITKYDALEGISTTLFENEENYYSSGHNMINGQKGLIFGSNGYNTRFINEDTTYLLDCNFDIFMNTFSMYEANDIYVTIEEEFGIYYVDIIDKSDCSLVQNIASPLMPKGSIVKVFDSPTFNEDYLLMGFGYGNYLYSEIVLLDKANSTFDTINHNSHNIHHIYENSFYRSGDELYFIGHGKDEPFPVTNLYSINLVTKKLNVIQEASTFGLPIAFGESYKDSTLFLFYNYSQLNLNKFKNDTDYELIGTIKDTRNAGLTSIRYLANEAEKIAFQFHDQVYFYNLIFGVTPLFESPEVSNLVIDDHSIEGLLNENDMTYHFSYDGFDEILNKTLLSINVDVISNSIALSEYILGQFSITDKIYFDLGSDTFQDIPIEGNIISIKKSKNHVLFSSECGSEFCLTSLIDGVFTDFQFTFQFEPEIYAKENGGFLILESKNDDNKEVYAINKNGQFVDKISVNGSKLNKNQEKIEHGPLGAMMFYNSSTEDLEVVLQRDSKFHKYEVPFLNASNQSIIWYKAGKSLIIKSDDNEEPGIYVCTLGKDLKNLSHNSLEFNGHNLLSAMAKESLVSIIVHSNEDDLQAVLYNEETQNIDIIEDLDLGFDLSISFDWNKINTQFQINETSHLITFSQTKWWEDYDNSEPLIYSTENLDLDVGIDINNNLDQSSNPHRFIENPKYLYFLARSPLDNSYQLFSWSRHFTTSIKEEKSEEISLTINPNPSANTITIDNDLDLFQVFDMRGKQIKQLFNYQRNKQIDISDMKTGMYFIEAFAQGKELKSRFIKI